MLGLKDGVEGQFLKKERQKLQDDWLEKGIGKGIA